MDEVGRATEVRSGSAIAAAVLEEMVDRGCLGLFLTHLHDLLDLDDFKKDGRRVPRFGMEVRAATETTPPSSTHRVLAGEDSRESLAFAVAEHEGIPPNVLARAEEYFDKLEPTLLGAPAEGTGRGRQSTVAAAAGGGGTSVDSTFGQGVLERELLAAARDHDRERTYTRDDLVTVAPTQVPPTALLSSVVYVLHSESYDGTLLSRRHAFARRVRCAAAGPRELA